MSDETGNAGKQNPKHRAKYRVFVSGRYASRKRASDFTQAMCQQNDQTVCPLYWFLHDRDDDQLTPAEKLGLSTTILRAIRECDYFVHLHENVPQRGGNLVELGMALALGKTVIAVLPHVDALVAPPTPTKDVPNQKIPPVTRQMVPMGGVFHELPQCYVVRTDDEALATLHRWIVRKANPSPESRGVQLVPSHVADVGEEGQVVYGGLGLVPKPASMNTPVLGPVAVEYRADAAEQKSPKSRKRNT
jgi:hypothetical protein